MTTGNTNRVVRQSPSGRRLGVMGFARLSISAPVAYVDGVSLQIPFDTIDEMSSGFGDLVTGGPGPAPGAFRLTESGIYLVQTFVAFDTLGTTFGLRAGLGSTGIAAAQYFDAAQGNGITVVGNALVTDVIPAPAADITSAIGCTGASGSMVVATCLILQVG